MFNVNSKFLAILALIMVFAMIFCAMGVAVFADDDHDHDHEEEDENKEPTWWDNYNQIIGWVIAGILGVAIIIVAVWWVKTGYKPAKK